MTILKVHDYLSDPAPLKRIAREVRDDEFGTDAFQQFVQDMAETLYHFKARGLAATQVDAAAPDGSVWRVFVMRSPQTESHWIGVANPRIIGARSPMWEVEGCLSFRSFGARMRAPTVLVGEWRDETGLPVNAPLVGVHARCFAHECEHLEGKTMLDRMNHGERSKFLRSVGKIARAA